MATKKSTRPDPARNAAIHGAGADHVTLEPPDGATGPEMTRWMLKRAEVTVGLLKEMPLYSTCTGWTPEEEAALRLALKLVKWFRGEMHEAVTRMAAATLKPKATPKPHPRKPKSKLRTSVAGSR
jgi:hypothetical protein